MITGQSFAQLGISFCILKKSIGRIVKEVFNLLWEMLKIEYVPFPQSPEGRLTIERGFLEKKSFPHVLGAIDGKIFFKHKSCHIDCSAIEPNVLSYSKFLIGKHVRIQKPTKSESMY